MNIKILTVLFFWILSIGLHGQYRFDHYTVDDGLSQNTVNDIFQDSEGYVWITTQDGLNRFDGYDFKLYKAKNIDGRAVGDNFNWRVIEDQKGFIWVCNREGVIRINKYTNDIRKFAFQDYLRTSIAVLPVEDKVYVVTSSELFRLVFDKNVLNDESPHSFEKIMDLDLAADAIVHDDQSIYIFEPKRIIHFQEDKVEFIDHSKLSFQYQYLSKGVVGWQGDAFLICTEEGLFSFNKATKTLQKIESKDLQLPCYAIEKDSNGDLWISTSQGLVVAKNNFSGIRNVQNTNSTSSLKDSNVTCIYRSKNGEMWVGYNSKGFSIYKPQNDRFKYLDIDHGLADNTIWGLAQFKNEIWVGTGKGVSILKIRKGAHLTSKLFLSEAIENVRQLDNENIKRSKVTSIFEDSQGRKFIGTYNGGCFVLDSTHKTLKHLKQQFKAPHSNNITSIVEYDSAIWITSFGGIFIYSLDLSLKKRLSTYDTPPIQSGYIFRSYLASDDQLYFGSNVGFYRYDKTKGRIEHIEYIKNSNEQSPGYYFVNDFVEDKGQMWLATYGGGFDKFDRASNKFINYNSSKGLANDVCSAILFDDAGNLWIGTNNGISKFEPSTELIVNYNKSDGLYFGEMSINVALKDDSCNLIFGTPQGLIAFNPQEIENESVPERPLITKLSINYNNYGFDFSNHETLQVKSEDKVISIDFASPNFSENESMEYDYRIPAISENWVRTNSKNRTISYSALPFGDQRFEIKSINKHGQESEIRTLKINVIPPFWLNTWFIITCALLIIILIALGIWYYFRLILKKKLRQIEVQQKIQKERERISGDLHDHVGAQLTSIISGLQITDRIDEINNNSEIKSLVDSLKEDAQNTMINLRDSIWSMNKEVITMESFVEHIHRFMDSYLKYQDKLTFEIKNEVRTEMAIGPVKGLNVTRTIEEAVQNIVKHAEASHILINISTSENQLKVSIKDDGVGFDINQVNGEHYGLVSMRNRIEEIEGNINIESSKGQGTNIDLCIK